MRSFAIPWIPHDDVILPGDIQGVPALGAGDTADPLVALMTRKLTLMRNKHAQTREYMEVNALRGIAKDGAGVTLYNYFTEFGITQTSIDFVLGTAGTKVQQKVRSVIRDIETNLKGEMMASVHALVSPEFFDKLIGHSATQTAYQYYSATGAQPLREDVRRNFPFAGILFEEYPAVFTLSGGTVERAIPAGEGIAFPMGTIDTFTTYGGGYGAGVDCGELGGRAVKIESLLTNAALCTFRREGREAVARCICKCLSRFSLSGHSYQVCASQVSLGRLSDKATV